MDMPTETSHNTLPSPTNRSCACPHLLSHPTSLGSFLAVFCVRNIFPYWRYTKGILGYCGRKGECPAGCSRCSGSCDRDCKSGSSCQNQSHPVCCEPGFIARLADSAKRFVSSSRGRTVHGVEVLGGYRGHDHRPARGCPRQVSPDISKPQASTRSTKTASFAESLMLMQDAQYLDDVAKMSTCPLSVLKPAAKVRFDSIVLWHSVI